MHTVDVYTYTIYDIYLYKYNTYICIHIIYAHYILYTHIKYT